MKSDEIFNTFSTRFSTHLEIVDTLSTCLEICFQHALTFFEMFSTHLEIFNMVFNMVNANIFNTISSVVDVMNSSYS